jgi:S-adenosylmethionine hydrolase
MQHEGLAACDSRVFAKLAAPFPQRLRRRVSQAMIVLFTDFGLEGPYTGQINAVLQRNAPSVPIIQLFADAPSARPKPAAYLLAAYAEWFQPGSVLLCVVDPGVGGDRRPVIAEAGGRLYVGPDNGLFEIVLRRGARPLLWEIGWRPQSLSMSFHGRDLFAPVAAQLARGTPPRDLAQPIEIVPRAEWPDDLPEIVYIDHYGNALTGLRGESLAASARLCAGERRIAAAQTFSAVPVGAAFWYVNSNGLIEIAVNSGRADVALNLAVGTPVTIE